MSSPDTPVADTPLGQVAPVEASKPSYEEDLNYIAKKVIQHECVLFFGAAIHAPAPAGSGYDYPAEKAPPFGSQLSRHLKKMGDYPGEDWWNLQRVAQHFESKKKRFRLVEEIKAAVDQGREPSPVLSMLADLEFPLVITTNYDHLYERALEHRAAREGLAGDPASHYNVSIYSPNYKTKTKTVDCPAKPDPKRPFILKIHGDFSKPDSIVVTDEDYIQFVLRMSDKHPYNPFGKNVLTHLVNFQILFIGYSLTDYNLRLLFKTLRWNLDASEIRPAFSVDIKPDSLIRDVWELQRRYVSFLAVDLWEFVPKLHARVMTLREERNQ
jgi:hypothetical protein